MNATAYMMCSVMIRCNVAADAGLCKSRIGLSKTKYVEESVVKMDAEC